MIYSDISSQRRPKGGVPNNWILIQDSDTKKGSFLTNVKESLTENITPFLNKMKTKKKNVKIICCNSAGENNNLKENFTNYFEGIAFEFTSQGTPQKNGVI